MKDLGWSWCGSEVENLVEDLLNSFYLESFIGGPSIRQQLKIDTLNKTLQKEQISTLKERDQVLKVR